MELRSGTIVGFRFSGHAGFDECGRDIVCSAVSSSVRMCCNGIAEVAGVNADVVVSKNEISLRVAPCDAVLDCVQCFLKALKLEISQIKKAYSENISLSVVEV